MPEQANGADATAAQKFETTKPTVARIYDYLLGGTDHFAADRQAAEQLIALIPNVATLAKANRTFLAAAELSSFIRPDHEPGSLSPMHNELGLRNVTFEVDDLQAILDQLAADGYHLVGGVGQYEGTWRMASVRGPEGFIVNLAQRIN